MLKYLKNVTTLEVDQDTCIGCGQCTIVCPHGVLKLSENKAKITDRDACIECGACAENCPVDAISVRAGVGCASGLIKGALGSSSGCCGSDQNEKSDGCCCGS